MLYNTAPIPKRLSKIQDRILLAKFLVSVFYQERSNIRLPFDAERNHNVMAMMLVRFSQLVFLRKSAHGLKGRRNA